VVPSPTGTPKASKTSAPPFEPGINTCTIGIFIGSLVVDDVVCDVVIVLAVVVKDVVVDFVVDVVAVVVVRVVVVHPANPNKIITPHIQIPNSHIFFLNIIQICS
jgi:hypothetical protein